MANLRYETIHTVETETTIVVRVIQDKTAYANKPRYFLQVGEDITIMDRATNKEITIHPQQVLLPYDEHSGRPSLSRRPGVTIQHAWVEAEEWVLRRLDEGAEDRLEKKRLFEEKQASFGKPKTRHTGKTEKNRNKKKGLPATT
jgi:hypothetical protein